MRSRTCTRRRMRIAGSPWAGDHRALGISHHARPLPPAFTSPPDRGCRQRRALSPLHVVHAANEEPSGRCNHPSDRKERDPKERLVAERRPEEGEPTESADQGKHTEKPREESRVEQQPTPKQRLESEENDSDGRPLVVDLDE